MLLTDKIKEEITKNCHDKTIENCGLILDSSEVVSCKNTHPEPNLFFRISTTIEPRKITAFYHSHPNGPAEFSDADKLMAEKLRKPCILFALGKFMVYEPQNYQVPLVGRTFLLGSLDCFTLVIDYYRNKLNIEISDIVNAYRYHAEEWVRNQEKEQNALPNHFNQNGFKEVEDLKKHDVILIKNKLIHFPIHCLIYLGNNTVLHHPYKKQSEIHYYSNFFKKLKTNIFRHEKV